MKDNSKFDLERLKLTAETVHLGRQLPRESAKILKRRQHFVQVPLVWLERLRGASGKTFEIALHLQYLDWTHHGCPFTLAHGMLGIDGIPRGSKWRLLLELERRGIILIERRNGKSPRITMIDLHRN
jgi:hypothetical protein